MLFFLIEIYAKLKSNSLIQAEPPVLHFSGFELGKDYIKIVVRKILQKFLRFIFHCPIHRLHWTANLLTGKKKIIIVVSFFCHSFMTTSAWGEIQVNKNNEDKTIGTENAL